MANAGRRARLTTELITEISTYIGNGLNNKDALSLAGVGETAFYGWKRKGEADIEKGEKDTMQAKLVQSLKSAEVVFKMKHLKTISRAGEEDWKASAWILERKYPNEFGKVVRQQADETDTQKQDFDRLTGAIERLADKK